MVTKSILPEIKWLALSLAMAVFLVKILDNGNRILTRGAPDTTFLGLNLFLEILVFFAFCVFVVFGIKGFFERFSHRFCNTLVFVAGMVLLVVIGVLSYQVLTVA